MSDFMDSLLIIVGLYTVARWTLRALVVLVEMSHAESVARREAGRQEPAGAAYCSIQFAEVALYATTLGDSGKPVRKEGSRELVRK